MFDHAVPLLAVVETAAKVKNPKLVPGLGVVSVKSDGVPVDTRSTTAYCEYAAAPSDGITIVGAKLHVK